MKKAHVELYLRLEKSVYKLGETINVYSECRVEGGITDVKKVSRLFDFIGIMRVKKMIALARRRTENSPIEVHAVYTSLQLSLSQDF